MEEFAAVYAEVREVLDERQRRLVLGAAARRLGRGGIKRVAAAVGVDPETVSRGVKQVAAGPVVDGRVRAKGAGRPPVTQSVPGVVEALRMVAEGLEKTTGTERLDGVWGYERRPVPDRRGAIPGLPDNG